MNPFEKYLHLLLASYDLKYEISILDRFKIESIEDERKKCLSWLTDEQLVIISQIRAALQNAKI